MTLFLRGAPQTIQNSVSAGEGCWLGCVCDCLFFVDCECLRLRSLSKERGGHPRWSGSGVAARRGNPGQESRNQGGRVHERVSGETSWSLRPLLICLRHPLLLSVSGFVSLCCGGGGGGAGSRSANHVLLALHVGVCACDYLRLCCSQACVSADD